MEASNLFWVSFLILDGLPPLKLVLISQSSCSCFKNHRSSWGRRPDKSQSARSISLEMEAVWSPPILTTSVWTEEEFIASLVSFPVAVNYQRLKGQFSLTLLPLPSFSAPSKNIKKKKRSPKDKTRHQGSSTVVISQGIMIDNDQQSVG